MRWDEYFRKRSNIAWGIGWALYLMLSKEVKRVYSD